ncbi:MAG: hypothetical protein IJI60_04055 [Bacilli bacterium]|nr:hypothetical protein [Bacilli bacterium]
MLNFLKKENKKDDSYVQYDYDAQREKFESIVKSFAGENDDLDFQTKYMQKEANLLDLKREIIAYSKHVVEAICGKKKDSIIEKEVYLCVRMMRMYTIYHPNYNEDTLFVGNMNLFQKAIAMRRNSLGMTKEDYTKLIHKEGELYEMMKPEEDSDSDSHHK